MGKDIDSNENQQEKIQSILKMFEGLTVSDALYILEVLKSSFMANSKITIC